MEYTITKNETSADLHLTYFPDDIEGAFIKAYEKASKKAKIDGFRPGKAPLNIVKKVLGESVTQDALNILLSDSISNLQSKLEFKTFGDPKIEIQKFERKETLIAVASFELAPEVQLGAYNNLPISTHEIEVNDLDIDEHLKEIQFQLAKTSIKESGELVEDKDLIDMDFVSKNSEGKIVQQKDKYLHYLGKNPLNHELEKHLIGMKVGEDKDFEYIYPETTPEKSLVGTKLFYSIKMNEIFKVLLPELDDAFANEWREDFQTLEDLKNNLKDSLRKSIANRLEQRYFDSLLRQILEKSSYKIPDSMIKNEIDHVYHESIHEMGLGHIPIEKLAEILKKDSTELKKSYEERASINIKNILGIYKIAELEKLTVEQDELENAFQGYRNNLSPEKLKEIDVNKVVRNLHENILIDKVFKFLRKNSKETIEKITVAQAEEILQGK